MTPEIQDERRGLPSASSIERLMACPGSYALEQQCPSLPAGEDAEAGTRIHAALAAGCFTGLSDDEFKTAQMCLKIEAELLANTFQGEEAHQTIIEERLWL